MKDKFKSGFTLAELMIVVVIVGVLVAISIPIFSSQLEKSRDAVSISSIRSAYAVAMSDMLTYNGYTGENGNGTGQNYISEGVIGIKCPRCKTVMAVRIMKKKISVVPSK